MKTKEKETKKEEINYIGTILIMTNILYIFPFVIAATKILTMEQLLYIGFPILILMVSLMHGYAYGKDYEVSIFTYILAMPMLIIIPKGNILGKELSYMLLLGFIYLVISLVGIMIGEYLKTNELKETKVKKTKTKKETKKKVKSSVKKMVK